MPILDQYGNPIKVSKLSPDPVLLSTPSQVLKWDDTIATGLTPIRLAEILRDNDQGYTLDMLTLAVEMEERDLHYFSQVQTRKSAVSGADICVEPGDDSELAQEIADAFKEVVADTPEFRWLIDDLMDAVTKCYSVVQPLWDTTTRPWSFRGFEHHDPRCFMFERIYKKELRIRREDNVYGDPLPPGMFVVHYPRIRTGVRLRGGIARLGAINYLFKTHSVKDWLSFAEVYGMPLRIGRYDPNTATKEELQTLRRALVNLGHDAAAMLPKSMDIKIEDARRPTSGDNLFQGLADYFDEQTSKAINGITTASDAKAKGIGTGESNTHRDTRQDIKSADALAVRSTLQLIARMWVSLNEWGPNAPMPRVFPNVRPPEDMAQKATTLKDVSAAVVAFKTAGKRIPEEVLEEEYGVVLEDIPAAELDAEAARARPPAPTDQYAPNAALPAPLEFAEEAAAGLLSNWQPLLESHRSAVDTIAATCSSYDEFLAKLKSAGKDIDSDPLVKAMAVAAMKARGIACSIN